MFGLTFLHIKIKYCFTRQKTILILGIQQFHSTMSNRMICIFETKKLFAYLHFVILIIHNKQIQRLLNSAVNLINTKKHFFHLFVRKYLFLYDKSRILLTDVKANIIWSYNQKSPQNKVHRNWSKEVGSIPQWSISNKKYAILCMLDTIFRQIKLFLRFRLAFVFGLQTL